jgi:hypothetical protein
LAALGIKVIVETGWKLISSHLSPSLAFDGSRPEKFKMDMFTERLRKPSSTRQGKFSQSVRFHPIHFGWLVKYDLYQKIFERARQSMSQINTLFWKNGHEASRTMGLKSKTTRNKGLPPLA